MRRGTICVPGRRCRCGGEVRQAAGSGEQMNGANGPVRPQRKPPPAAAVAERALRGGAPGFQLVRAQRAGGASRQRRAHCGSCERAAVVNAANGHRGWFLARVHQPQQTSLRRAGRVEHRHPANTLRLWCPLVEACRQGIAGARVGEDANVQRRREHQPPVALRRQADAFRQADGVVPVLQIFGVEMHRGASADGERQRAEALAGIVDGGDGDFPSAPAAVDDAHEPLALGPRCAWQKGHEVAQRGGAR